MTPITSTAARFGLILHVVERLRLAPEMSGVGVYPGWPGDKYDMGDLVWVSDISGTLDIPFSTSANLRHSRDDQWSCEWLFKVIGPIAADPLTALAATAERLSVLVGALEDLCADDPSIDDWPGTLSAQITDAGQTYGVTPERPVGFGRAVMSVSTRLD
jgi:hypothetical protein